MIQPRKAYIFRPMAAGLGGVTPPDQVERGALAIVAEWNRLIPANQVRVITQGRFDDLRRALATFEPLEVLTAIQFYSRQRWQRDRGAWCAFDHFIQIPRLIGWVERAQEAAARTARAPTPARPDPQAAGRLALRRRFDALPRRDRQKLFERAAADLSARLGERPRPASEIMARAIELMVAGENRA